MFYEYKNRIYAILFNAKAKNPQTREWEDSFIYSPVENNIIMDIKYVREKKDFLKKFKKVDLIIKD